MTPKQLLALQGITLEQYLASPLNTTGAFEVPKIIQKANARLSNEDIFNKLAYSVYVACDVYTGFKSSGILEKLNYDYEEYKNKVGAKRVAIFIDAVFYELNVRLKSGQFPEFSNLLTLVASNVQVYGNTRDFALFGDYLNKQTQQMLYNAGWTSLEENAEIIAPNLWRAVMPEELTQKLERLKRELEEYANNRAGEFEESANEIYLTQEAAQETYATKEVTEELKHKVEVQKTTVGTFLGAINSLAQEVRPLVEQKDNLATKQEVANTYATKTQTNQITTQLPTFLTKSEASRTYATKSELQQARTSANSSGSSSSSSTSADLSQYLTLDQARKSYTKIRDFNNFKNEVNSFKNQTQTTLAELTPKVDRFNNALPGLLTKSEASNTYATKSELQQARNASNSATSSNTQAFKNVGVYNSDTSQYDYYANKLVTYVVPVTYDSKDNTTYIFYGYEAGGIKSGEDFKLVSGVIRNEQVGNFANIVDITSEGDGGDLNITAAVFGAFTNKVTQLTSAACYAIFTVLEPLK
ncbi:hypothetical protein [Mycoplasmopsis columboralis]|uniref:Uncharacterized protein n=1 Tax=Mycoplasmopsis columboralis TaxID=171282 RepID=A0A449B5W8_9BACT|nr:hypothetical protein [Mycoplasmopsis columboralis]VEU75965.1 Uncharacterised protein [Mycoplasmopsis columboralis]